MGNDLVLRDILETDCRTIWCWRNHPQVRRQSNQSLFIGWHEHRKWFFSKIKHRKAKIYLAMFNGNKIGVIRFEIEDKHIKVSVNLNPDFFGKGLGSKVIAAGTKRFLSEIKTTKRVIAEIKRSNIISQRAFLKAAYKFEGEKGDNLIYAFINKGLL